MRCAEVDGYCAVQKHIQKWFCVLACYRRRSYRPLSKLFQRTAALVAGTACPKIDCCCAGSIALLRQGNWKWTARASTGALWMKAFFKAVIWIAVIVAGLVGWNVAPDFR